MLALCAAGRLGWSMLSASAENDGDLSELTEGEADASDDEPDSSRPNGGATTSWKATTTWRSTSEVEEAVAGTEN